MIIHHHHHSHSIILPHYSCSLSYHCVCATTIRNHVCEVVNDEFLQFMWGSRWECVQFHHKFYTIRYLFICLGGVMSSFLFFHLSNACVINNTNYLQGCLLKGFVFLALEGQTQEVMCSRPNGVTVCWYSTLLFAHSLPRVYLVDVH